MGSKAAEIMLEAITAAENQKDIRSPRYRTFGLDHNINWHPISIELAARLKESVRYGVALEIFRQRDVKGKRQEVLLAQWGELMHGMQPVKDLLDKGIAVHLEGGDPLRKPPLAMFQFYVSRKDEKGRVWGANQSVDRHIALLMTTRWAARYFDEDRVLGSIEPGKFADLVVLDRNPLEAPEDHILKIPVVITIVAGRIVYKRDVME